MTKTIVLNLDYLRQARERLTAEGFECGPLPLEALERGVVMTAYRKQDLEGFLINQHELGLLARYGIRGLDTGYSSTPRYARANTRNREAKYAEAVLANALAQIYQSGPGGRNQALNRAAYSVGTVAHYGLDREKTIHELVKAATDVGLPFPEAAYTARRAFAKGEQHPRDLGGGV